MSSLNKIGKTATERSGEHRTVQMFGRAFDDVLPTDEYTTLIADGITSFDLLEIEPYHEVIIASSYVNQQEGNIKIDHEWYKPDDTHIYTYTYEPPSGYTWAWSVSWLGWCPWEIDTNGVYYVKIRINDKLIDTLFFSITGISLNEPIPPPGRAELVYTIPSETSTAKPEDTIIAEAKIQNAGLTSANVNIRIEEKHYIKGGTIEKALISHVSEWQYLKQYDQSDAFKISIDIDKYCKESGDFIDIRFQGQSYVQGEDTLIDDTKTVRVYTGGFLLFRVQTPSKKSLSAATVRLQRSGHSDLVAFSDESGYCEIAIVPPFEGTAIASHQSYRDSYPLELTINSYGHGTIFLEVLPMVCKQKFIVSTEDGTLLAGARVTMTTEEGEHINSKTTDTDGECTINFTEQYFIPKACCQGYECQQHDTFQCDPDSTIFFYLTPEPPEGPDSELTQQIVAQNAIAMSNAIIARFVDASLPGFTDPPHLCPICGESFNNVTDYIIHIGSHTTAYEEQKKEWL